MRYRKIEPYIELFENVMKSCGMYDCGDLCRSKSQEKQGEKQCDSWCCPLCTEPSVADIKELLKDDPKWRDEILLDARVAPGLPDDENIIEGDRVKVWRELS